MWVQGESRNAGWPAFDAAPKANHVNYMAYIYGGANHSFHNDTTPRYDKAAAELAWSRTMEFFNKTLRERRISSNPPGNPGFPHVRSLRLGCFCEARHFPP